MCVVFNSFEKNRYIDFIVAIDEANGHMFAYPKRVQKRIRQDQQFLQVKRDQLERSKVVNHW